MRTIRLFFTKTGEAAYISHLDLQRVMARALRRSGVPVWYSQGFNPHIYLSFALPLPLAQESVVEMVDFKTEVEDEDFGRYIQPLNAALPRGIVAQRMAPPVAVAGKIAAAEYTLTWPQEEHAALAGAVDAYNRLDTAPVLRKTKRSEQTEDLKLYLPALQLVPAGEPSIQVRLPAGSEKNLNSLLLVQFLAGQGGPAPAAARILRTGVFTAAGEAFC